MMKFVQKNASNMPRGANEYELGSSLPQAAGAGGSYLRNCCVVTTLHSVVPIVVWVEKWLSLDTWQS
jgi:hypothetical protein